MEGTRSLILQQLQGNGAGTVAGLASALGLAPATIRQHLDILQRNHMVTYEMARKKMGRPEHSFYLTEEGHEAMPKGYGRLLGMMMEEMSTLTTNDTKARDGSNLLKFVLTRISEKVSRQYGNQTEGKTLSDRLTALMHHLKQDDFSPEAEVVDGTLQIKLSNCPFRSVAMQNKAVCTFDLNLIANILDLEISRDECIHDGSGSCTYSADINPQAAEALMLDGRTTSR